MMKVSEVKFVTFIARYLKPNSVQGLFYINRLKAFLAYFEKCYPQGQTFRIYTACIHTDPKYIHLYVHIHIYISI
jgi:hypothetical protein